MEIISKKGGYFRHQICGLPVILIIRIILFKQVRVVTIVSKRKIKSKILLAFLCLILPSVIILNALYYFFIATLLEKQAIKDMQQLTNTLSNQLDDLIGTMNRVAANLAFNQELFQLIDQNTTQSDHTKIYNNSLKIKEILQHANEISYIARNLYIYTKEGTIYDFGVNPVNTDSVAGKLATMPWIEATYNVDRNFLLVPPHPNPWADGSATMVFSITRAISDINQANPIAVAIVEVQQDYEKIERIIQKYSSFFKGEVLVVDPQQKQIYPYSSSQNKPLPIKFSSLAHNSAPNKQELSRQSKEIIYAATSDYTKWTTIMHIPNESLFSQINVLRNIIIGLSGFIVLVFVIASMIISRRLSAPIVHIKNKLQNVTFDYPLALIDTKRYYVEEIDQLYDSFREMISRLRFSHDEIVASQIREHNAYINALQAQINPHFIYNSLAVISSLGDDIGEPTIKRMCIQLSDMLRYTTDQSRNEVEMADEIRHVENYLNLLQVRYENHLEIEIRIDTEMLAIPMPKLSLQPFVENAYLHGVYKILPPWKIAILGEMRPTGEWSLIIEDNGIGIADEAIIQLERRTAEWRNMKTYGELGGLGIANTYIRLKDFYGPSFQFSISQRLAGGTKIELTRKINQL